LFWLLLHLRRLSEEGPQLLMIDHRRGVGIERGTWGERGRRLAGG
jgi:hypothetical protein